MPEFQHHLDPPKSLSTLDFALRTAAGPDRQAWAALAALHLKLSTVSKHASDPTVTDASLAWWAHELRCACQGQAQHPITRALYQDPGLANVLTEPLLGWISGLQEFTQLGRLLDEAALLRHASALGAPLWVVAAISLKLPELKSAVSALGTAVRLVEIISGLGSDARAGRLLIPIDDLQAHQIKAFEIIQAKAPWPYDQRYLALMQRQAERARARLRTARQMLTSEARAIGRQAQRQMRPAFAVAALAWALLDEIEATEFQVLHQRVALTPLRKWWITIGAR